MSENMNDDLQKFEDIEALISVEEKGADEDEKGAHEDEKGAPSVFMTDIRFKEAVEAGDLLDEAAFAALDPEDQKGYEMVNVLNEETKEPMGWMFRFKADDEDEAEDDVDEAEAEEADEDEDVDMVEKVAQALEAETKDADDDAEVEEEAEEADAEEEAAEEEVAEEEVVAEEVVAEEEADADAELPDDAEDPAESVDVKAASIMMRMAGQEEEKKPSIFLTDARFKEMEEDEELISEEKYGDLDMDAKESYEEVEVFEEGTGKGYGKRYRRRSPLEVNAMRKGGHMEDEEKSEDVEEVQEKAEDMVDMFDTEEEALERAAALGCEGTHGAGDKFMPCASHDEWEKLTAAKPEDGEKSEEFLCGFQRKSVAQPCDFCQGGCAPEDGLPGLADIETVVKSAHPGEVIGSGYSSTDDMFVVDVKREDGTCIEVFLSGEGDELGWLRVDETIIDGKSAEELTIISSSDAEAVAVKAFDDMELDAKGEVMGIMVDIFADEDVYVVEVDSEQKSFDFYVSVEGKVLGYDEYDMLDDFEYDMSEEDEIKALEAELEIKRMYSREQRESMAESGEAMEDGSFPIADEADLKNAIQAHGRAKDVAAAKAHIVKRAKELGLEEMIPEGFMDEAEAPAPEADGEKSDDAELLSALDEFRTLMEGEGS